MWHDCFQDDYMEALANLHMTVARAYRVSKVFVLFNSHDQKEDWPHWLHWWNQRSNEQDFFRVCFLHVCAQTHKITETPTWTSLLATFCPSQKNLKNVRFMKWWQAYIFTQVNPSIKFEIFIHKVDGLSDDHKIETQRDIHQRANDDLTDAGLETLHLRSVRCSPSCVVTFTVFDAHTMTSRNKVVSIHK